ncbi:MAG: histidine phosphatase family protein [Salinibacterium sp.]|nr:histidine phosphatase family protein [Salinibacterium sp.]MBF0672122.1 histidine phosphatase family protein [Salinibacterium sp.]
MPASLIHLVRHGEVHNPEGVLYGRIPGYLLSELGHRMADAAAQHLEAHPVKALFASPLERAQESAKPWSERFGLEVTTDERLIEPTNKFEGQTFEFGPKIITKPQSWPWVMNPFKPSWGEPFASVADRMLAVIEDAWNSVDDGEVVMVSHQMPIVMVQRYVTGRKLYHDPRKRRCSLSSITTLRREDDRFVEHSYAEPAAELLAQAADFGAV